jgi:hypothetical protein
MRPNALFASAALALWGAACRSESTAPAPVPVTYTASLNAANERPTPVNSAATGLATLTLTGDTLAFTITATALTSRVTGAHIHVGSASVAGGVVTPFPTNAVTSGTVASGVLLLSTFVAAVNQVSGDSLRKLLDNGNAYVNVHTRNNLDGEIRGQVVRVP